MPFFKSNPSGKLKWSNLSLSQRILYLLTLGLSDSIRNFLCGPVMSRFVVLALTFALFSGMITISLENGRPSMQVAWDRVQNIRTFAMNRLAEIKKTPISVTTPK